jgi:hypothetical protein
LWNKIKITLIMAILFRKYQYGGGTPPIYDTPEDLKKSFDFSKIRKKAPSGNTRCLGMGLDAAKVCGFDFRSVLYNKGANTSVTQLPWDDKEGVVDSWNMKEASYNSEDLEVIYDREKDGPISEEMLKNLPMYAMIGTGDARKGKKKYISPSYEKRVSRHSIINLGFTPEGDPIIYDMGDVSAGIPKKYTGEINFIAAPKKDRVYFGEQEKKEKQPILDLSLVQRPAVGLNREEIELVQAPESYYGQNVMALLHQVFGRKQVR